MSSILVIAKSNECDSLKGSKNCTIWKYDELIETFGSPPNEWINYASEYFPFMVGEKVTGSSYQLVFISHEIETWALIANHILLNRNNIACQLVDKLNVLKLHLEKDYGLFKNRALKCFSVKEIESIITTPSEIEREIEVFQQDFDQKRYLSSLTFPDKIDDHQITNEWGAKKLAINAGYSASDIDYEWPQTIYFKYLNIKYETRQLSLTDRKQILKDLGLPSNIPLTFSSLLSKKRILLIDDNAEKGWSAVLSKVFGIPITAVEIKKYKSEVINGLKCLIDPSNFDLIFLDLRIPSEPGKSPDMTNGIQIIDTVKKLYPAVPLIVFTASQRASTLDLILEHGADAMYVKESPQYANEEDHSQENFRDFAGNITHELKKYRILRSFWECIERVKSAYLAEINDFNPNYLFKSRITERLLMFYGLLKKGQEQWDYDANTFFYSDYELAFITLWSILNEIQEAYFEKGLNETKTSFYDGKDTSGKPRFVRKKLDEWKIRNQTPDRYFILKKPIIEENIDSTGRRYNPNLIRSIKYSSITSVFDPKTGGLVSPYYQQNPAGYEQAAIDYKKSISLQIAFLILNKAAFNHLTSSDQTQFLKDLYELNISRNALYLTHGENTNDFYSKKEIDKRANKNYKIEPTKDIKRLFQLVAFLLTGLTSIKP